MRAQFKKYLQTFFNTEYAQAMKATKENSPYHREDSVWVHTMMMLNELDQQTHTQLTEKEYVMTALAILFHDVGKPKAKKECFKEEYGGAYFSFARHESLSARIFETVAMRPYVSYQKEHNIKQLFNLTNEDIFWICWMIEYHLIYKGSQKIKATLLSNESLFKMYATLTRCDVRGRIADDHQVQIQQVEDCLLDIETSTLNKIDGQNLPICYVLIGSPGVGKSTYCKAHLNGIAKHSWDDLRVQFYLEHEKVSAKLQADEKRLYDFAHAYALAHNSEFKRFTQVEFVKQLNSQQAVIVDNTNTIKRNRDELIDTARNKGYQIVAIYFLSSVDTLYQRNQSRTDKYLTTKVIDKMYYNTTMPVLGEVEHIIIV